MFQLQFYESKKKNLLNFYRSSNPKRYYGIKKYNVYLNCKTIFINTVNENNYIIIIKPSSVTVIESLLIDQK